MRGPLAPSARAASTNSRSFSDEHHAAHDAGDRHPATADEQDDHEPDRGLARP